MRSSVRRTARLATLAVSVALLAAACGAQQNPGSSEPTGDGVLGEVGGVELTAGTLLISDGTARIAIGDATVTFPGPVTDAAWSPDGSRIAYVDGDGNIATARPDGSDVLVLTSKDQSVVRSRPTWSRQWILYAEKKNDGTSALRSVPTNGCAILDAPTTGEDWSMDTGDGTSYVDLAPSASTSEHPMRVAFQHEEPAGSEIWLNDTNQRVPETYKLVDGSEPALSLDGQKLAYVGRDGDIYVTTPDHPGVAGTKVTSGAQHPTRLAWSPDGQYLAYATASAVQQVSAVGGANAPTTVSSAAGVPTYLPGAGNALNVVTAGDPTALSVAVSAATWPAKSTFFVAQGDIGAYMATIGLAQRPPASGPGGPLLLLDSPDELDPRVTAELNRVFGAVTSEFEHPRVYLASEISANLDDQLEALGYDVHREAPLTESLSDELCRSSNGRTMFSQRLVVVDGTDPIARALGEAFAAYGPVLILDGALTDDQSTWLRHSSGVVESVYAIGTVPEDVQQQIAALISGPLGVTTTHNPTVPPLN
jgi:WD40-like Beta Propeller Repeat